MSTASEPLLPASGHTRYQSIGSIEPDEQTEYDKKKIWAIVLGSLGSLLIAGTILYGVLVGKEQTSQKLYSNGTHTFAPTVILISLDGTVNHDLHLHLTPNLNEMARNGARAKYMTPSFPVHTFPNHWSLVTGLYPESHGIVGNYFYDAKLNDSFYYKSPEQSWDSKWWGGEPIWITAVRQNKKSGVIMWPGCSTDFNSLRPSYTVPFSNYVPFEDKVNQVFDWIDLSLEERPQFIGVYVPQIDQAGHAYGPYADETKKQLKLADYQIGKLIRGLETRNLTNIVNLVIVSDHGMAETHKDKLIYYEDYFTQQELDLIWRVELEPTMGIRVFPDENEAKSVEILYQAFKRLQSILKEPHFEVYKKQDLPDRFHFTNNDRIPPLLVLPDPEWNFCTYAQYDPRSGKELQPKGVHGYDNLAKQSRAIFVAQGPDFPKGGQNILPFRNVEVYQVLSRILDLEPSVNNNTLNGILEIEI